MLNKKMFLDRYRRQNPRLSNIYLGILKSFRIAYFLFLGVCMTLNKPHTDKLNFQYLLIARIRKARVCIIHYLNPKHIPAISIILLCNLYHLNIYRSSQSNF